MTIINKLFGVENLIPKEHQTQPLPSSKEVYQKTLKIAWPSAMEAILISLIGAVDMIMVGGLGTNAIAAVGITTQPKFLMMAFVLALNTGTTVVISRRKGANNIEGARRSLRNALVLSFGLSLVSTLIGILFSREILLFSGANLEYINDAVLFFNIILFGNFFYLISLTITAAQRGVGNTKISLITNVTANVINISLNYPLIYGWWIFPKLGIAGSAVSTTIGNIVCLGLAMYSLSDKKNFLHVNFKQDWSFDKETLVSIWKISSSALIEQVFIRIGFMMYSKAVAGLGTLQFATHYIVMQVMSITFSAGDGLSIATSSLVGQSLGANRLDLAYLHGKVSQRIGMIISVSLAILIVLNRYLIMSLFSHDQEIINLGAHILIILSFIIQFQIAQVITVGSLRGAGDVKFVALLSLVSVTVIRPVLTFILAFSLNLGLYGAWFSVVCDQMIRYYVGYYRFKKAEWVKIKV
jgi:putative MATE family efflux protein